LVWKAKSVRARTTAAVNPTASSTSAASYRAVIVPSMNPSQQVKRPRNIMLWGLFLLTPGQQARMMRKTKDMTMATHTIHWLAAVNPLTESRKKRPMKAMVRTSWAVRIEYTFLMKPSLTALSEKLEPMPS